MCPVHHQFVIALIDSEERSLVRVKPDVGCVSDFDGNNPRKLHFYSFQKKKNAQEACPGFSAYLIIFLIIYFTNWLLARSGYV